MSEKCRWLAAEIKRLFLPWGVDVRIEWRPNPFNAQDRALHVLLNKKVKAEAYHADPATRMSISMAMPVEAIEPRTFGMAWARREIDIEDHAFLEKEVERLFHTFFLGFHKETARTYDEPAPALVGAAT